MDVRNPCRISCLVIVLGVGGAALAGEGEALWRARTVGVAHLENGRPSAAVKYLVDAVALGHGHGLDHFNLGLAYLAMGDLDRAKEQFLAAQTALPRDARPRYALGILALRANDPRAAKEAFRDAVRLAPRDCGALYHLGVVDERLGAKDEAARMYERVMKLGWSLGGRHFLASMYRHARILLAQGRREEATRELKLYQDYFKRVGKPGGEVDLQSGPLLWPVYVPTGLPPVEPAGAEPVFERAPVRGCGSGWGEVALADLDGDGLQEVLLSSREGLCAMTMASGAPAVLVPPGGDSRGWVWTGPTSVAVPGDVDNDGDVDLYLLHPGVLLRNDGAGRFEDVTARAGLESSPGATWASWVDFDQEGDLDLLVTHGARPGTMPGRNRLWVNRSDGTFEERRGLPGITEGHAITTQALAVDLDDDGDTDLVLANADRWPFVMSNLREGKYQEIGLALGLGRLVHATRVAISDLDGDGHWDLVALLPDRVEVIQGFVDGPKVRWSVPVGAEGVSLADLDLDGHEELLVWGSEGLAAVTTGDHRIHRLLPGPVERVVAGDLDRDGDPDLVALSRGEATLLRNQTPGPHRFVRIELWGRKNNRLGVGSLVELRSGGFYLRRLADGSPLVLGLGGLSKVDAVRIRWPNGLFQNVVDPGIGVTVKVKEVQELAGSCPFLYSWDGERYRFVTDFLGGGGLGLPAGPPGEYLPPDPDEYLFLSGDLLRPDAQGDLVLQLTEELREEQLYLDMVRLHVLDHPEGTHVYPDERFIIPGPRGTRRFAFHEREASPPESVLDDFGNELRDVVAKVDGHMAGSFIMPPEQFRGLVEPHSYVIDLGDTRGVRTLWLIMTGWVYWAGGSTGVAASQAPGRSFGPVRLEVQAPGGGWEPGIPDIGFPSGKTKTMPVDLTGVLRPREHLRVRITTTLRLHWDQILVVKDPSLVQVRETVLGPRSARLYDRGFSRRVDDRLDRPERFVFDDLVSPEQVRFNQGIGWLTRYGDVLDLLSSADDRMVVMSAGDAIEVRFGSSGLPALPPGWRRDYLVYFEGWNKDGDPNNGTGATVGPLPFHGMPRYPYTAPEHFPDDPAHVEYLREYNTRPAARRVLDMRPRG